MKWVTWDEAAIAAAVSYATFGVARQLPSNLVTRFVVPAAKELGFVAFIYSVWRVARQLPLATEDGAIDRARWIADFQEAIFLPSEISIQRWVMQYPWLVEFTVDYYAVVHVPATITFMIWIFVFRRPHFIRWRTTIGFTTFFCLLIRFVRTAPPRFVPELGFVNLSDEVGIKVYGSVGTGVSDQYAAMPSIHIAWAAIATFGVIAACTGAWRWLLMIHLTLTFFVVAATGHHWWADGIVALLLIWISLRIDDVIETRWRQPAAVSGRVLLALEPSRQGRSLRKE